MADGARTAIIGAGAAGLSLAMMLDGEVLVYEKEAVAGGLCRSTTVDGFTFDQGPHVLGGIPDAVDWIVDHTPGVEWVVGETRNVGWLDGDWLEHPFADPAVGRMYQTKMWKLDPSLLVPSMLGAQKGRKPGGVKTFLYPKRGGYQAITDSWAEQVWVGFEGVSIAQYDRMIHTEPAIGGRYNDLLTVTLGYRGKAPNLTACYLPGPRTPFHRLSFPAAFSSHNAPPGCFAIQGEISRPSAEHDHALADLVEELWGYRHPVMVHTYLSRCAYPLPVEGNEGNGHGRTGSMRYLNVDGVVAQSMELAASLNG